MFKTVTYKGHTYHIGYRSELYRDLSATINHTLFLDKVDNKSITSVEHKWADTFKNRKSIVGETHKLIKEYINRQDKEEFSYLNEFENWDGDLDSWDE